MNDRESGGGLAPAVGDKFRTDMGAMEVVEIESPRFGNLDGCATIVHFHSVDGGFKVRGCWDHIRRRFPAMEPMA